METIIEIKDVDFSYRNNTVLEKVNLEIEKEDFTAFIGPNGSGKTTLMELIVGNLKPERGIITLFGENSDKYKKWKNISYIPQKVKDFNKSFPATVKEIIASDLYQKMGFIKIMTEDIEGRIKEVLDLVGMGEYKNRKIGNLSGGQQQRIFLARSLSSNPEVILLDEPMAGVDAEAQEDIYELLNKLNENLGITIIMISHDIHVIGEYVNKIVCFSDKHVYLHQEDEINYDKILTSKVRGHKRFIKEHRHQ